MTNEAPHYSAASFWMSQLTQAQFEQVIRDAGKEGAQKFRLLRETLLKALHLRNLTPEERLAAYQLRAPEVWGIILQTYPEHYRKDQQDWYALLGKLEAGDLDEAKYQAAMDAILMSSEPIPAP